MDLIRISRPIDISHRKSTIICESVVKARGPLDCEARKHLPGTAQFRAALIVLAHLDRHTLGIEQRNDGDIATCVTSIRLHIIRLNRKLNTLFGMREKTNVARPIVHLELNGKIRDPLAPTYSRATHNNPLLEQEGRPPSGHPATSYRSSWRWTHHTRPPGPPTCRSNPQAAEHTHV